MSEQYYKEYSVESGDGGIWTIHRPNKTALIKTRNIDVASLVVKALNQMIEREKKNPPQNIHLVEDDSA